MKNYVKLLCLTIFCLSLFACDSFCTEDVEFIEPKPIINKDISHIKFENLRTVKNVDISGVGGYESVSEATAILAPVCVIADIKTVYLTFLYFFRKNKNYLIAYNLYIIHMLYNIVYNLIQYIVVILSHYTMILFKAFSSVFNIHIMQLCYTLHNNVYMSLILLNQAI